MMDLVSLNRLLKSNLFPFNEVVVNNGLNPSLLSISHKGQRLIKLKTGTLFSHGNYSALEFGPRGELLTLGVDKEFRLQLGSQSWKRRKAEHPHDLTFYKDDYYYAATIQNKIMKVGSDSPVWEHGSKKIDSVHVNGVTFDENGSLIVTYLGCDTDKDFGWKERTTPGEVLFTSTGVKIPIGMPHSPFYYEGTTYVLDTTKSTLVAITGTFVTTVVNDLPGFVRGLYIKDGVAVIGSSWHDRDRASSHKFLSNYDLHGDAGLTFFNLNTKERMFCKFNKNTPCQSVMDIAVR